MKRITPNFSRECAQRQSDAGRYNPARVALVNYNGRRYSLVLAAGDDDWIYGWQAGAEVQVLSLNWKLGYCGLQVFKLGDERNVYKTDDNRFDGEEISSVFLQADHEIKSALGKRGLDLSPTTIRIRLAEYCYT